jgi:hypothetical protein
VRIDVDAEFGEQKKCLFTLSKLDAHIKGKEHSRKEQIRRAAKNDFDLFDGIRCLICTLRLKSLTITIQTSCGRTYMLMKRMQTLISIEREIIIDS